MKRPKLKRCPACNSRPHYMNIGSSSGYVLCNVCHLDTKRYDDFIESWQEQAAKDWNEKSCMADFYASKIDDIQEYVSKIKANTLKVGNIEVKPIVWAGYKPFTEPEKKTTNQETLSLLTAEECYNKMVWIFQKYGRNFGDSRTAIIEWLKEEAEAAELEEK